MENTRIFERRKREMNTRTSPSESSRAETPRVIETKPEEVSMLKPEPMTPNQPIEDMEGGDKLMKLIYPISAVLAVVIAAYFTFMFTSLQAKQVSNEARFQCAQSSRYTVEKSGTTIYYPAEEMYKNCLDEKGVK